MGEPYSEILKKRVNIVAANGSSWSVKFRLAILTAKNCFIHLSTRTAGWLLLTFLICLHNQLSSTILSIKCGCLKNVIHQIDCKNEWCSFQHVLRQNLNWFLSYHWKKIFLRGFILKPTERAYFLLKSGTSDFQNSPPLERSPWVSLTISEKFKRFQYFNFQTDSLENENLFQKTGVSLFSWKY